MIGNNERENKKKAAQTPFMHETEGRHVEGIHQRKEYELKGD